MPFILELSIIKGRIVSVKPICLWALDHGKYTDSCFENWNMFKKALKKVTLSRLQKFQNTTLPYISKGCDDEGLCPKAIIWNSINKLDSLITLLIAKRIFWIKKYVSLPISLVLLTNCCITVTNRLIALSIYRQCKMLIMIINNYWK